MIVIGCEFEADVEDKGEAVLVSPLLDISEYISMQWCAVLFFHYKISSEDVRLLLTISSNDTIFKQVSLSSTGDVYGHIVSPHDLVNPLWFTFKASKPTRTSRVDSAIIYVQELQALPYGLFT